MYSILILGLIPGTHIEVSFLAWLVLAPPATLLLSRAWLKYCQRQEDRLINHRLIRN